mgnify:CR=1 FL=1
MKVIYKYRLPFKEESKVIMPQGSTIIRVDGLDGALWLWAVVDPSLTLVERTFYLVKTGGELPEDVYPEDYVGCGAIFIQMELMMYVFEKPFTEKYVPDEPAPFDWKTVQED